MTAPERIWAIPYHGWDNGNAGEFTTSQTNDSAEEACFVLATPEALAASPEVAALIAEARREERERCVEIAVRHWEGEPEDTIAMAAEMRVGMKPLSDYEKKVAQMREDFPNGI